MAETHLTICTTAYLASTRWLTVEEQGAYILLLLTASRSVDLSLPDDDRKLARITGLSMKKWKAVRESLACFWRAEGGRLFHVGECTNRRERKAISRYILNAVWERDGNLCTYCGTVDGPFEIDHIYPWSLGGPDTVENLCVACAPCNRSKGNKLLSEWRQACH